MWKLLWIANFWQLRFIQYTSHYYHSHCETVFSENKCGCCKWNESPPFSPKSLDDVNSSLSSGKWSDLHFCNMLTTSKVTSDSVYPIEVKNKKNYYYVNAALQYLFCISRTMGHNWQFDGNAEGCILQCLISHSNSNDKTHPCYSSHNIATLIRVWYIRMHTNVSHS